MISFEIPGRPQPQERPFVLKRGWTIDRQKSKKAKKLVQQIALEARQRAGLSVSGGYFLVRLVFCCPHASADIDNLCKLVLDGLKGVFWKDDRQVVELIARKIKDPYYIRTEVEVERVLDDDKRINSGL